MDDHHITSLLGQSPDAHWNDSRSGLTVIAESSSGPSVALPEINVFGGDVAASAPSRKSTQRSDPQDLEAKLADESITHEQHKPISRTDTAGAQSWKSKITQNFHHLSRTASNESNFAPRTPVRNSTIQTNASASFDDTAPWDKKAILSLGKLITCTNLQVDWTNIVSSRWRRNPWLLGAINDSCFDGSHRRVRKELQSYFCNFSRASGFKLPSYIAQCLCNDGRSAHEQPSYG